MRPLYLGMGALIAVVALLATTQYPDAKRYFKIRSM